MALKLLTKSIRLGGEIMATMQTILEKLDGKGITLGGKDAVIKYITRNNRAHYEFRLLKPQDTWLEAEITSLQMKHLLDHGSCETLEGLIINLKY